MSWNMPEVSTFSQQLWKGLPSLCVRKLLENQTINYMLISNAGRTRGQNDGLCRYICLRTSKKSFQHMCWARKCWGLALPGGVSISMMQKWLKMKLFIHGYWWPRDCIWSSWNELFDVIFPPNVQLSMMYTL